MPEITLRDLCRWDRRLEFFAPVGEATDIALDRAVTWAVSVRAAPPHLPPLRGDELVVLPMRVMAEIEAAETLTREELLANLERQHISALLSEPEFVEGTAGSIPVITLPAPFPHDAESTFNRIITERRAELYRLGTELSRRLSRAALDPRGVSALLDEAEELAGKSLVLQDAEGNVVAQSVNAPVPAPPHALKTAANSAFPVLLPEGSRDERLIVALVVGGSTGYLSMSGPTGSMNETDRLILGQTAGTCSIVLDQFGRLDQVDRSGRERLVADLMLGRLASEAAALSRGQMLGIDPGAPLVIGLINTNDNTALAREILVQSLGPRAGDNIAPTPGGTGFILTGIEPGMVAEALRRRLPRNGTQPAIALSRPVESVAAAPAALREASFALELLRAGALAGPVVACSVVDDLGLFGLLYPLWGHPALDQFLTSILQPLIDYDARRHSLLIDTLDAYLSHGGALAEAADDLGIHRNTLSYRLQRIRDLTGRDISNPQHRLMLQVALLARRLPPVPN